jgi:hypothetical protein
VCLHARDSAVASVRSNGFSAYWYRKEVNFGDLITPTLLKYHGFTPVFTRPCKARLAGAGSILEHLPDDFTGVILGSGFILESSFRRFRSATIIALRGELSRQRIGPPGKLALGDPGLLASDVMPRREQKKFALGIVPHYLEKSNPVVGRLISRLGREATLIDAQKEPLDVFSAIDQCEHILSSSLHGLIVADSLGIPNCWIAAENLWGGRFKFDDYYSAFGMKREPASLNGHESLAQLLALAQPAPGDRILDHKESIRGLWASLGQFR